MSWTFEIEAQCKMFRVITGNAEEGAEMVTAVTGEHVGDGFVRSPNVTAVLSGSLTSEYEGFEPYTIEGFGYSCPHHPDKQVAPGGMAIATAGKDMKYFCISAATGVKLDHEWHELDRHAGKPGLDPYTFEFDHEVCLVVATGQVDVNGMLLNRHRIARGTKFTIEPVLASIIVFVWER